MAQCFDKYTNINNYALNPTLDETYSTIQGVLFDINNAFNGASYLHLGKKWYIVWSEFVLG